MEEPIRFADILFTALTLLIIYLILALVNKSKRKNDRTTGDDSGAPEESGRDNDADIEQRR